MGWGSASSLYLDDLGVVAVFADYDIAWGNR